VQSPEKLSCPSEGNDDLTVSPEHHYVEPMLFLIYIATAVLLLLPYDLKKGEDWYLVVVSIISILNLVSMIVLFRNNMHWDIFKFLVSRGGGGVATSKTASAAAVPLLLTPPSTITPD
jgi:hypothetical protein